MEGNLQNYLNINKLFNKAKLKIIIIIIMIIKLCKDLTSAMDQIKGTRRARMSGRSPEGKFGRGLSGVV